MEMPDWAPASAAADPAVAPSNDVDAAFDEVRTALIEEAAAAAEERLTEAERLIEAQDFDAAITSLEEAMCAPHLRASAGSRLAKMYRDRGEAIDALACLEWVVQVPPATEESGHELAYQLALTLEAIGQHEQALGVYRELLAEVGPQFRDVATRAERLAAA
jgi:tetratricopeptide (TPR) repeat protein